MIDGNELKIDIYRSSGADGVMTRVVRVTHIPSGIEATSGDQNSEAEDRAAAIREIEQKLRDHPV